MLVDDLRQMRFDFPADSLVTVSNHWDQLSRDVCQRLDKPVIVLLSGVKFTAFDLQFSNLILEAEI